MGENIYRQFGRVKHSFAEGSRPDILQRNIVRNGQKGRNYFESNRKYVVTDNIVKKSQKKNKKIQISIQGLRKEQSQLQRLLQVEKRIDLPQFPLLCFQQELDKNLEDLREELQSRKLQIKDLLLKQEGLCNILEEPKLKLYEDPLSSAEDIEFFKENLTYLHNLKLEREKTMSDLRADIAKLSNELDLPILDEPCYRFEMRVVANDF